MHIPFKNKNTFVIKRPSPGARYLAFPPMGAKKIKKVCDAFWDSG